MLSYLPAMEVQLTNKAENRWVFIEDHIRPVLAIKRHPRPKHDRELVFSFHTVRQGKYDGANITVARKYVTAEKFSAHYGKLINDGWTVCDPI